MITSRPIVTILEILYMFLLVPLINSVTFLAPCDVAALYVHFPLIRHKSLPPLCWASSHLAVARLNFLFFLHENELELESNLEAPSSISKRS